MNSSRRTLFARLIFGAVCSGRFSSFEQKIMPSSEAIQFVTYSSLMAGKSIGAVAFSLARSILEYVLRQCCDVRRCSVLQYFCAPVDTCHHQKLVTRPAGAFCNRIKFAPVLQFLRARVTLGTASAFDHATNMFITPATTKREKLFCGEVFSCF